MQLIARLTPAALPVFALCLLSGCFHFTSNLPDYGRVPEFAMSDSKGQRFRGSELAGKVWVADFIYTNCPAECPLMTSRMHAIQKKVRDDADVELVSISVDPLRDTPQALDSFAKRFGGPTDRWVFLTGSPDTVHLLAYTTFHVGDVIDKIEHSTKFILVDKRGDIRGYYSSFDQDGIPQLLKDVAALRRDG